MPCDCNGYPTASEYLPYYIIDAMLFLILDERINRHDLVEYIIKRPNGDESALCRLCHFLTRSEMEGVNYPGIVNLFEMYKGHLTSDYVRDKDTILALHELTKECERLGLEFDESSGFLQLRDIGNDKD